MSCAAAEPGTERARAAAARGSAGAPGRGRGAGAPPQGGAGRRTPAAPGRRAPACEGPGVEGLGTPAPAEPQLELELSRASFPCLPFLGSERRAGAPPTSAPLGELMLKGPERVLRREATRVSEGDCQHQPRREINWGAGRRAPGNVKLRRLGAGAPKLIPVTAARGLRQKPRPGLPDPEGETL